MKQILTSKVMRKLFILSCLVFGLIAVSGGSQKVSAAFDSCQEQSECLSQAESTYYTCDSECPPFAGCYYQCWLRYEAAQNACYETYPCP